jgi:C-terminal processing protease CtpA/Prc
MKKLTALLILATLFCSNLYAQNSNFNKEVALSVLKNAKESVKKYYYDKEYHGKNLDVHFKEAEEKIKQAQNAGQLMGIIAQSLIDFDDSHLFFLPPPSMNRFDYGIELRAHGENVFIHAVKPGSDAEAKGLKSGDRLITINSFPAIREKLWVLRYLFYALRPQPALRLVIQSPDQPERTVDFNAKVIQGKRILDLTNDNEVDYYDYIRQLEEGEHVNRHRYEKIGEDIFIWKMPGFNLQEADVDIMFGRIKKCKSLILDLRGNGGGYVDTLKRMVTDVFDQEIKIAERNGRKELKPIVAKRFAGNFEGKIIVLIDHNSGSASEIFARVMQLEKRGTVLGDRSAGAVMESLRYSYSSGMNTIIPYGFSVTDADVIMKDGKSIEHVGVAPDEMIIPTGKDLATGRDLVLARAVEILGGKLTAEAAGKMFPIEWVK